MDGAGTVLSLPGSKRDEVSAEITWRVTGKREERSQRVTRQNYNPTAKYNRLQVKTSTERQSEERPCLSCVYFSRSAARCSSCGAMSHRHRTNSPGRAAVPPQSFLRSTDQRAPGWLLAVQPPLQERAWRRCVEGVGPEILLYKSMVTH